MYKVILVSIFVLLFSGCASIKQDCYSYVRGSHEFRECRANEGSKEYQYRMGVQDMLLGNHKKSREWLRMASKTIPDKKVVRNKGVAGHPDTIFRMRTANAEDGNDAANFILAKIYQEGIGVTKDIKKAEEYSILARNILVETEEFDKYFMVKTYRITRRDQIGEIINKFQLTNFQVNKNFP